MWRRFQFWLRRKQEETELNDELQAHLAIDARQRMEAGVNPEEAAREAQRALGNRTRIQEDVREAWGWQSFESLLQDIRYCLRTLRKYPSFTFIAIATLALGIGGTTAVFSVVSSVLLEPLPYKDSDRLVRVIENIPAEETISGQAVRAIGANLAELVEWRPRSRTLSQISAQQSISMTLTNRVTTLRISGARVSPSLFPMLDARPLLGRPFRDEEELPGADDVAILSYRAWQRYFAGDSNILGTNLTLDGRNYTVVGVMPSGFEFPNPQTEYWLPFMMVDTGPGRRTRVGVTARLRDGVSIEAAAAETAAIFRQMRGELSEPGGPATGPPRIELVSIKDQLVAPVRPALIVVFVAVGFVLLIACSNVANLMLSRMTSRQAEMAIRTALGASRGRVSRQILTESLILALSGGFCGILVAFGLLQSLPALAPADFPRLAEIRLDVQALGFALLISTLCGLLFGLAPALRISRLNPVRGIHEGTALVASGLSIGRRQGLRGSFIIVETTLAMVLLVGAGLLLHSFVKLSHVDAGFDSEHVLTFELVFPQERYPDFGGRQLLSDQLVARLRQIPGIVIAGYVAPMLPLENGLQKAIFRVPGLAAATDLPDVQEARYVSWDFLPTMGVEVIQGRGFRESDSAGQPLVMVINQRLARLYFGDENPIGKVVRSFGPNPWEIVGVVADIRQRSLAEEPVPQFFVDFRQWTAAQGSRRPPALPVYVTVRTENESSSVIAATRSILGELDQYVAVDRVASMAQLVSGSIAEPRFYAVLLGVFAGIATTLSAIGLYGVVAYSVSQRTREIGIRMALGARRGEVVSLVTRQGVMLASIGIVLGLVGAVGLTRYLAGLLFGITPLDATTFVLVAAIFAVVALLASFIPARRATRVDPVVALRCE